MPHRIIGRRAKSSQHFSLRGLSNPEKNDDVDNDDYGPPKSCSREHVAAYGQHSRWIVHPPWWPERRNRRDGVCLSFETSPLRGARCPVSAWLTGNRSNFLPSRLHQPTAAVISVSAKLTVEHDEENKEGE